MFRRQGRQSADENPIDEDICEFTLTQQTRLIDFAVGVIHDHFDVYQHQYDQVADFFANIDVLRIPHIQKIIDKLVDERKIVENTILQLQKKRTTGVQEAMEKH